MSGRVARISLLEGEEVLHDLRPKWSKWFWSVVLGVLLLPVFFIGIIPLWGVWRRRKKHRYIITTERVIYKRGGWLGTSTDEYRISDIRQIQTRRAFSEKLLGGGTIVLDTGPGKIKFQAVPNHQAVVNKIREQQRKSE